MKTTTKLIIILFGLIFVLIHIFSSAFCLSDIFDNFSKFAIGAAALITAYYGSNYFIEEVLRKRKIEGYRNQFPYGEYGKTWEIISREDSRGEPHVLNKKTLEIHHLWNQKTIFDLGWQFYWKDQKLVTRKQWDKYKRGDYIRTRGELGE
jgi:hypothetical protein